VFGRSKDVFDNEISIDDTCIVYGGRYGIPPQLIKGQIEQEAGTYDFGGTIGSGFAPSYRYEPYSTQLAISERQRQWERSPFFVTATAMGSGACVPSSQCPPEHQHVLTYSYILFPKTLWDIVYDYSQLVIINPPSPDISEAAHRIYGSRNTNGTMNFGPYDRIQGIYDGLLNYYLESVQLPLAESADSARNFLIGFMRDDFYGGFENLRAQTRIASSYGLLQMMYTTAVRIGYDRRNGQKRPEDLNVTETLMKISMDHQKILLRIGLGRSVELGNNWPNGLEKSLKDVILANWNTKEAYPNEVMTKSRNYLPRR